jgi:hypothetical protein
MAHPIARPLALALATSLAAAIAGCGPEITFDDAGADATAATDGRADTARVDTGRDVATGFDAGRDTGAMDTGTVDARPDVVPPVDVRMDTATSDTATDAGVDVVRFDGMAGGTCSLPIQGTLAAPPTVGGSVMAMGRLNVSGFTSRIASVPMCPINMMTTPGEEHIYVLNVAVAGQYEMTATGEFVPTIAVRTGACTDETMQLTCNRINVSISNQQASQVSVQLTPGAYYLVLDRVSNLPSDYVLTVVNRMP